ncbi:MAG: HNH endonuclease [Candidatus Coatesbacteria bacterium]|nr:MAG: HNH endonuclease [Candidatus Coatesbacteria bacterium]
MPNLNANVLLLNASYEPMAVVGLRRAIGLIYLEKAETLETNGLVLRSPTTEYAAPSVIRLMQYINPARRRIKFNRRNVLRRDGFRCQYCGRSGPDLTLDHIVPLALGGKHLWENVVACCQRCNNLKADRTPEAARMELRSRPKEPAFLPYLQKIYQADLESNVHWRKYLFLD